MTTSVLGDKIRAGMYWKDQTLMERTVRYKFIVVSGFYSQGKLKSAWYRGNRKGIGF